MAKGVFPKDEESSYSQHYILYLLRWLSPPTKCKILIGHLNKHLSPKQKRHLFRGLTLLDTESFADLLLRLRRQMQRCTFGSSKAEIADICLKDKL